MVDLTTLPVRTSSFPYRTFRHGDPIPGLPPDATLPQYRFAAPETMTRPVLGLALPQGGAWLYLPTGFMSWLSREQQSLVRGAAMRLGGLDLLDTICFTEDSVLSIY